VRAVESAVNPHGVHDHGQSPRPRHDRLFHPAIGAVSKGELSHVARSITFRKTTRRTSA
jgi:hypothetical protein